MMVLIHIDWGGTQEQLKDFDEAYIKTAKKTDGVEFVGRMIPLSKKYHYTMVLMMDNMKKFYEFGENWDRTRDYSLVTHGEYEFYN